MVTVDSNVDNFKEFCGVTEDHLALRFLHHCNGDLQAAVQLYFQTDGILTDEAEEDWNSEISGNPESNGEPRIKENAKDHENVTQNTESSSRHTSVVRPWRQLIFAIITLPFNFVLSAFYDVLQFFYELVVGERVASIADIRRDVANFRGAVNEKFRTSVEFFDGTFDEAFLGASLAEKVFAVYMFTPGARHTEDAVRRILADNNFNKTVNDFNMILWGADPRSKAGRDAARKMNISTFPCFVALSSRDESMLMCIEMPTDAEQIWPLLRQCALEEIEFREEEHLKRRMLHENRQLMEQQEREYRESEERDRAMIAERRRQQKLQEEETIRRNKEEQERMEKNAKRLKVVKHLRGELIANHAADDYDGKDSIRVLVRYPSGETSQHRFSPDENTQSLFGVIFAKPCCPDYFEAHYGFPRRRLDFYPEGYHVLLMDLRQSLGLEKLSYVEPRTFREFGINSSLTLYISDIDS